MVQRRQKVPEGLSSSPLTRPVRRRWQRRWGPYAGPAGVLSRYRYRRAPRRSSLPRLTRMPNARLVGSETTTGKQILVRAAIDASDPQGPLLARRRVGPSPHRETVTDSPFSEDALRRDVRTPRYPRPARSTPGSSRFNAPVSPVVAPLIVRLLGPSMTMFGVRKPTPRARPFLWSLTPG